MKRKAKQQNSKCHKFILLFFFSVVLILLSNCSVCTQCGLLLLLSSHFLVCWAHTLTLSHPFTELHFLISSSASTHKHVHAQPAGSHNERRFICKFSCFGWRTIELRIVIINIICNNMIFILVVSFDVLCFFLKIAKCNLMRMWWVLS